VRTVEDVAELISGQHVLVSDVNTEGEGDPYLTGPSDFVGTSPKAAAWTTRALKFCAPRDILITVKGSGCGTLARADQRYAISRQLMAIRAKNVDPDFLWCAIQRTAIALTNHAAGTIPGLTREQVLRIAVPVPRRGSEKRVAGTVALVEQQAGEVSTLLTAKLTIKRGLAQHLLAAQKRFPEFGTSKWTTVALGDVLTYTPRKVPKPPGTFLSAGVRSHGKGVFLKKEFPSNGIALEELFVLRHLDFVVNITFGWEGAVAIVPPEADGALVSHRFPTYELDPSRVLPEYFRHAIRTRRFVYNVGCASPGGAGRNRVLNRPEFLEIPLSLPSIAEQSRIAEILDTCDREINLLEQLGQQIELQKRVLLSRLLSDEFSVSSS
jgi:type I restriction enzyme S subunit